MRLTCLVMEETSETYKGKNGEVTQSVVSLQDMDVHARLKNTFDYNLREEEKALAGKLRDKRITVDITEFQPAFGGRLRARGRIVNEK
jgi:hypothetical protein